MGWWLVMASVAVVGYATATHAKETPATHTGGTATTTGEKVPMAASVQDNMDVGLEYTLTVDGKVMDSTDGRGPFHYVHGQSQLIPGLEHALTGMHPGDTKEVTVTPEDGYGLVNPSAIVEVPKKQLPNNLTPAVGTVLRGVNPDGKSFRARITEVKDQSVMLDLNHPLAGKTLMFKVKVTDVGPPKSSTTVAPPKTQ